MTLKFSIFSTNFIQNNFAEKRKFKYSMDFSESGIAVMLQANAHWEE